MVPSEPMTRGPDSSPLFTPDCAQSGCPVCPFRAMSWFDDDTYTVPEEASATSAIAPFRRSAALVFQRSWPSLVYDATVAESVTINEPSAAIRLSPPEIADAITSNFGSEFGPA